jgi:hypothetical protein
MSLFSSEDDRLERFLIARRQILLLMPGLRPATMCCRRNDCTSAPAKTIRNSARFCATSMKRAKSAQI